MAHEISTSGFKIGYKVETTAGSIPTGSFTNIPNIKAISEINPEPATYDVTDLSDTVWKRYIGALKDIGGAISLTANITEQFKTAWASCVSSAQTAEASSLSMWFEVLVPGWSEGFFFAGMPSELGLPGIETDAVFEGDVFITPNQIKGWNTKADIA